MSRFSGKLALITGAAGVIGRATSLQLASEGATLVVVDKDEAALQSLCRAVEANGGSVHSAIADVTSEADTARYVQAAADVGQGSIDCFFANAGVEGPIQPVTELEEADFEHVWRTNVVGPYLGLRHVIPFMGDGGSIVVTGSTASLRGEPKQSAYVTAKHAVLGLMRSVAQETAAQGIRVNAIAPGPVNSAMMARIEAHYGAQDARSRFSAMIPTGRYCEPEEVASAVAYLLSADSTSITGTTLSVDGGLTA